MIDQERVDTALWMADYAEKQDLEPDADYVFSPWDSNLMYNYFVSGDSSSYGYAKANYRPFAVSKKDSEWSDRLENRGTGFLVVHGAKTPQNGEYLAAKLTRFGSSWGADSGSGKFRAIYRSSEGATTVYTPVRGALVSGTAPPNSTATIASEVNIDGARFRYGRNVTPTHNGRYGLFVPYPGTYSIDEGNRTRHVVVQEAQVEQGASLGTPTGSARWKFDEGRGRFVFDSNGPHHGTIHGGSWASGVSGHSLELDGDSYVTVKESESLNGTSGLSLTMWVRTSEDVDYVNELPYPRLAAKAESGPYSNTSGYQFALAEGTLLGAIGDGPEATVLHCNRIDDGRWHHAAFTWNGTTAALYLNGQGCEREQFVGNPTNNDALVLGATTDHHNKFIGSLDEVRIDDHAITKAEIRQRLNETQQVNNG